VPFGYDVPILLDHTYAKNEPSEHMESGEMSIGANCVKIRICIKKLHNISSFQNDIALMHFPLQFVNVHLTYISVHIL
jgi:hypothetical protein